MYSEHDFMKHKQQGASLAQSAARQSHNLKVVSSSLTGGTDYFFLFCLLRIIFLEDLSSTEWCGCVCMCLEVEAKYVQAVRVRSFYSLWFGHYWGESVDTGAHRRMPYWEDACCSKQGTIKSVLMCP